MVTLKTKNRQLHPHRIWMTFGLFLKPHASKPQEITQMTRCCIVLSDPGFGAQVGFLEQGFVSKWITILGSSGVLFALCG